METFTKNEILDIVRRFPGPLEDSQVLYSSKKVSTSLLFLKMGEVFFCVPGRHDRDKITVSPGTCVADTFLNLNHRHYGVSETVDVVASNVSVEADTSVPFDR